MTDRVIRVVVDSSGVVRGSRQAQTSLGQLEQKSKGVSLGFKAAAAAAAVFAGSLAVREIIRAVDTYQSLQNRLRIVTDTTEELAFVQQRLFEISQKTRTSFDATARLYGRAAIAADELGASQEELLRLTEISGKALAIQGGAASESAGALIQLSQSFSSGIVRAEEFNSILEGAFPLAQAAARGFGETGISVGKLRNLVIEGKVSSEEFFRAILKGGEGIDKQFAKTQVTIGQATTTISNSFLNLVGKLNETTGAGAGVAGIMQGISASIDDLAAAFTGVLQPEDEVSAGLKLIASTAIIAGTVLGALADSIKTQIVTVFNIFGETIGATAAGLVAFFSGEFERAGQIFSELGESVSTQFVEGFSDLGERLAEDAKGAINLLTELWDAGSRDIIKAAKSGTKAGDDKLIIVGENAIEDVNEARDAVDDFLDSLINQEAILQRQATLGDAAAESIKRYQEDIAFASAEQKIFGDLVPTEQINELREAFVRFGQESLKSLRSLREEIENAAISEAFDEQIEALELEIELLGADNEMLAINAELRALATGATAEQAAQIRLLTEELLNQQDQLQEQNATLTGFFEEVGANAQRLLSGILADPLADGLDELPFKFAQILQQLAADALASELFKILRDMGSGGSGGGAGGIGQFIGGLFGGGFASGGQVTGGQPILVGERGPELFTPPGSGSIQPNVNISQAAQAPPTVNVFNVMDPEDVPPPSDEDIVNVIQRNPEAIRRVLS